MNNDYTVKLGEYRGVHAPKLSDELTQEEIDTFMHSLREEHATFQTVNTPAALGDTVVLDYAGYLGDVQFEGGTAQNVSLSLGSGTFIPGFEDQLVGHAAGDNVDVHVTFPEDYSVESLAGKPTVFHCKLREVQQRHLPPLGDEFAKTYYNAESYDLLLSIAKAALKESKQKKNLQATQQTLLEKILNDSQVTVSEDWIQASLEQTLKAFTQQLSSQGVELADYYKYTNTNEDQLKEQLRPQAETAAKMNAILLEIAEVENLTVSDQELDKQIEEIADSYEVTLDELKAHMTEVNRESIRAGMLTEKALDLITKSAIIE